MDIIYFGSLYEALSEVDAAKYPKVAAWAHLTSQAPAVKAAVETIGQQVNGIDTIQHKHR